MDFARLAVPNLSKLLRKQDQERFSDSNDDRALPRIFVAYTRASNTSPWIEAGVVRLTQRLTLKHVERVRRSLKLGDAIALKLVATSNRDPKARRVRQWSIAL